MCMSLKNVFNRRQDRTRKKVLWNNQEKVYSSKGRPTITPMAVYPRGLA
jgi:hypothetical protein